MSKVSRPPLGVLRRGAPARLVSLLRAPSAVALAFALLAGLVPLNPVARAQEPAGWQYRGLESSPTFVIQQTPEGETFCRDATPAESEALDSAPAVPLRQINHLLAKDSASASESAGLTIILRGTPQLEANQAAKQAFINAAARWEAVITNRITIYIDVDYGTTFFGNPFPSGAVAVTRSTQLTKTGNYTEVRSFLNQSASTPAESALYSALPASSLPLEGGGATTTVVVSTPLLQVFGLLPAAPPPPAANDPRPQIGFNASPSFPFDFTPDDGPISGTDFDAAAVHEIGHVLGFSSAVGDTQTAPNGDRFASLWDIFRFRPGAASTANFATAPRVLGVGGEHVHFGGAGELKLSTGGPAGNDGDRNQASHWKDNAQLGTSIIIGIMDPTITPGTRLRMTANDRDALEVFGYKIKPSAPPNDNFASAQSLVSTSSGRVTGTNVLATREAGEPSHSPDDNPGGKSVWYVWTPPAHGTVTFSTGQSASGAGSSFDTVLAAYTGSGVGALTPIVKNNDAASGNTSSSVTFTAFAGSAYFIAVDGWNAAEGDLALNWNITGPPVTVQFSNSSIVQGEAAGSATVEVTRTGSAAAPFTVNYATSDEGAVAGSDYQPVSGTLSFAAGEMTKSVSVPLIDDTIDEPTETVKLQLSGATNGVVIGLPTAARIHIGDDDPSVSVSVSDAAVTEGNAGTVNALFNVTLASPSAQFVTVGYTTANDTAHVGPDYFVANGTVNFAPGETSKPVAVAVLGDAQVEGNETFFLNIDFAINALIADGQGVATIIDDDAGGPPPTGGALIRFGAEGYLVSEADRAAQITITRSEDTSLPVSVDVRTVDNAAAVPCNDTASLPGVAFARCDYATTIDTVTFAPGETQKTIAVPVIDDSHGEPTESVQIALSNPSSGARLGPQTAATLLITSDESPAQVGAPNPILGIPFFVRQHYLDFLSREPEAGEPWSKVLADCPDQFNQNAAAPSARCDRPLVSAAFVGAPEFALKGRYAFRFYKVAFGRLPQYTEIVTDMRQLTGATGQEVINKRAAFPVAFAERADFRHAFDSMTNEQFVNTLMGRYNRQFISTNHPASPEGGLKFTFERSALITALNTGQWTRWQVLRAVADSDEVSAAEFRPAFVAMQYYGYLRRTPEPGGYEAWLNYLNNNPDDSRTMVNGFMNSQEYRLRFGRP